MNQLAKESSPYLLQHADNPVDWYPWGQEAIERARSENKPILVSIGYSTCHWCHVMEKESFTDEAVADFMNAHFINIKVDREERPDLDAIYMEAVQILTGSGGWPLNCFLTPELKPFFGGTYYPPEPKYNRPSWLQVLKQLQRVFHQKRNVVDEQAEKLMKYIRGSESQFLGEEKIMKPAKGDSDRDIAQELFRDMASKFDKENGGFGSAPKFPNTMGLTYFLAYAHYRKEEEALSLAEQAVRAMIFGGIYDQIGGGFARYSVDKAWLVPHFEKMLYDNALLLQLIARLHKVSPHAMYEEAILQTFAFLQRELRSDQGYYYAALDADSEGEEGKFYVWDADEIDDILGEHAGLIKSFYGVEPDGNWEGKNILHRREGAEAFARKQNLEPAEWRNIRSVARDQLLNAREKRVRPGRDEKALLAWNAMLIPAFVEAYQALGEEMIKKEALNLMHVLQSRFCKEDGTLVHSIQQDKPKGAAFLDDYAWYIRALLYAYQLDWSIAHLKGASEVMEKIEGEFGDENSPMLFYSPSSRTDVVVRKKELMDNATPSANAVMAMNYYQMGIIYGDEKLRKRGENMTALMRDSIQKYPLSFSQWAQFLLLEEHAPYEIAIVGQEYEKMAGRICEHYFPEPVIMASETSNPDYPLLKERGGKDKTQIYLCREYVCSAPVSSINEFQALLD